MSINDFPNDIEEGMPLYNEASIRYLTDRGPINDNIEEFDENGDVIDYMDFEDYYCMNHKKYDLGKITKKFICEAPIGSGTSNAIRKWKSSQSQRSLW